jgi:hypothetical protein
MNESNCENKGPYPPWSRIPDFEEKAEEAGVKGAEFLEYIQKGYDTSAIAELLNIKKETADSLYEHFMQYGIHSVMGGD